MFTQKQINELLKNKNVDKCSPKSITYNNKFKVDAVKKYYQQGYSPSMIFKEAGFDLSVVDSDKAKGCLGRWRKIYNEQGEAKLSKSHKGGPRRKKEFKTKYKNSKEKIKYLETKLAYLEEENKLLKKMKKFEKP